MGGGDVGSALLVVVLMVAGAAMASMHLKTPRLPDRLIFKGTFARLVLATTAVVYVVLVSGILVAGKGSITACLGWPIYSLKLFRADGHAVGNALRWILSLTGVMLLVAVLVLARRNKLKHPTLYKHTTRLGVLALLEALLQGLLLIFGQQVLLLIGYTITAAIFWALLVMLLVQSGIEEVFP